MAEAGVALGILKCAGGAIPQCIPQDLKDKLTRPVSYVIFYGSNIADIPTKIEELKGVKVEVEARWLVAETNGEQIRHKIQGWLNDTKEIIEKFDALESNNCFCVASYETGKMLDGIKKMLDESEHFQRVSYPGGPTPIGSRYHAYNKNLLSREKLLSKISKALKDSNTNMISIDGIPGVGKTTLLEELVKRVEADKLFQDIAKVNTSQTVDAKMIQTAIASRIGLNLPEKDDEEARADSLYHQLEARLLKKKSKILVIFDGICTESGINLERIGIPFLPEGEPSCTIFLSSSSSNMCKMMGGKCNFTLGCLDLAEAKILFRNTLGSEILDKELMSKTYISTENDLLQKCGGLPLAITAFAGALKVCWPDWDNVVGQLNHNWIEVDGVKKALHQPYNLIYNSLENRKKNFFLLCCLFQPGASIAIEDLIRYGIGLKLFGKITSLDDVTRRANLWVDQLKSLSLFESKDDQGCVCIGSIIQDFAISVAAEGEYLLLLDDDGRWETKEDYKMYTIISMRTKSSANHKHLNGPEFLRPNHDFEYLDGLELPKLEALFFKGESSNLRDGYFSGMKNLRVLSMVKMKLPTLPPSIEHLKYLLTLSLEDCDIEDASLIILLVSLKVLSFRGSMIKAFPEDIGQLGDLKLLDITKCCFGMVQDGVVSNLSHLEGLYMCGSLLYQDNKGVVTTNLVDGLKSFERLNVLEIEIPSTYLVSVGDRLLGSCPSRFKIAIGCKVSSPYKEFQLFKQALLLKEVDARMLRGQALRELLKTTEYLSLVEISNLKKVVYDLDEDGLVDLKYLHISHCNQIECIVNTVGMSAESKILAELEILSLEQLDRLKVICHGRTPQNCCSKLRELKLSCLRELEPHVLPIDHARELAVVEVRDCACLQHIFSMVATPETNINDAGYDFPCLKKLDLQRLPSLEGLWAAESTTGGQAYQPLFHEKINLPSLEELYLSNLNNIEELWVLPLDNSASGKETFSRLQMLSLDRMPKLKHIWVKELCKGSSSFKSLKKIEIIDCEILESLCPPKIPAALSELDSLEITSCNYLKEVIMTETEADNVLKFPSLRRLKLEKLSSLRCFGHGNHTIEFPSLKILLLSALPKMLTFSEPKKSDTPRCPTKVGEEKIAEDNSSLEKRVLFIREIVLPSLEHLELSAMEGIEEIVEAEHAAITIPNLKTLHLDELGKLKHIPETILEKLEELKVRDCVSLQGLFEFKPTFEMTSLRNLELVNMGSLKHIPINLLPKLHSLVIHGGLRGMKYILSSTSIVEGNVLQQLEYINIEQCEHLEEIVSKKCDHELDHLKHVTRMFPKLKHIKLESLPNITTFSSGSCDAILRALEKVEISRCPSLVSFSLGTLKTPKLASVQLDQLSVQQKDVDLNCLLKQQKQGCSQGYKGPDQDEVLSRSSVQGILGQMSRPDGVNEICEIIPIARNGESITSYGGTRRSECSTSAGVAA